MTRLSTMAMLRVANTHSDPRSSIASLEGCSAAAERRMLLAISNRSKPWLSHCGQADDDLKSQT
jgi:hypothetical protein